MRVCAPTARPTLRHALEDVQEAHEEVLDLVPVQLVAAQHGAAERRRALVLEGGGQEEKMHSFTIGGSELCADREHHSSPELQRR